VSGESESVLVSVLVSASWNAIACLVATRAIRSKRSTKRQQSKHQCATPTCLPNVIDLRSRAAATERRTHCCHGCESDRTSSSSSSSSSYTHRAGVSVALGVVVDVEDVSLASACRQRRWVVARCRRHRRCTSHVRAVTNAVLVPRLSDSRSAGWRDVTNGHYRCSAATAASGRSAVSRAADR